MLCTPSPERARRPLPAVPARPRRPAHRSGAAFTAAGGAVERGGAASGAVERRVAAGVTAAYLRDATRASRAATLHG